MKVFRFSGMITYNYGDKIEIQGGFAKGEGKEIIGYLEEMRGNKITISAIKGLYDEATSQMLFVKTGVLMGYSPEIFIFEDSFTNGWVSSYHKVYKAFSVYAGVRNGLVQLESFREIFESEEGIGETYLEFIRRKYEECYDNSTKLSKTLIEDVSKYEWLFRFVKHLKGSSKNK